MLNVQLITVGKLKEAYLREACQEYAKRLGAYCRFQIVEVEEYRLPENPSPAQILQGLEQEGRRIESKLSAGCCLVTLCIEGKLMSSPELAGELQRVQQQHSQLALVIGGSYGIWEELKKRSRLRLSISPMTFPHQLCRVMVCEQLYRAFSIAGNGKYHK